MNSEKNNTLQIIEVFPSVQGETSLVGLPTTFIRLAKCNLRCTWCDTTYSFGRGQTYQIDSLINIIDDLGCRHVCITGGEPLLQNNVHILLNILCDRNYKVCLETSGSLSTAAVNPKVTIILDIKCPGSEMSEKNFWENIKLLRQHDQVKFVLKHEVDYVYAKEICYNYRLFEKTEEVLFSPVFGFLEPKLLVSWILRDKLPIRLNLQMHKFIWSPETKGV